MIPGHFWKAVIGEEYVNEIQKNTGTLFDLFIHSLIKKNIYLAPFKTGSAGILGLRMYHLQLCRCVKG